MINKLVSYILERTDYKAIHGHDKVEVKSNEWYFHNYEHGYKHCIGGSKNPYELIHIDNKHGINKEYARGHGINRKPQWFKFTKKLNDNWYDLNSGQKVEIDEIPKEFK